MQLVEQGRLGLDQAMKEIAPQLGEVEVLEGLNEGDLVVIEGTQSLRPKAKVNVMNKDQISQSVPSANILRPGPEPS